MYLFLHLLWRYSTLTYDSTRHFSSLSLNVQFYPYTTVKGGMQYILFELNQMKWTANIVSVLWMSHRDIISVWERSNSCYFDIVLNSLNWIGETLYYMKQMKGEGINWFQCLAFKEINVLYLYMLLLESVVCREQQ